MKKKKFKSPIIGIETIENIPFFYNTTGDCSVMFAFQNPVDQYASDSEQYYSFHKLFSIAIRILGAGVILQKHDVISKKKYTANHKNVDFLSDKYFEHFENRIYTDIQTYLVITYELSKNRFFSFDQKRFSVFKKNIIKVLDLFQNNGIKVDFLSEEGIKTYLRNFLTVNFADEKTGLNNLVVNEENIQIADKIIHNISLVDIDEVELPAKIKPCTEINIGLRFPVDLMSFLFETPDIDTLIYNQTIIIPDQKSELNKLEAKKKKHSSMIDPANELCVEDISKVMIDVARNGQFLIYAHYNIILAGRTPLNAAINYIESTLIENSIIPSKQCINQLELFEASIIGNATSLPNYDRFLTTSDAALCLFFKERIPKTEFSPFLTYFTNRQGLPIGVDVSGKEGELKLTDNSNFFVLGPSGSGKSFCVNSAIRQWVLQDTDIVLVDTGHSYYGICSYYGGRYISYTDDSVITMNPFKIEEHEYNEEKVDFLKSLIALLWKGSEGEISQVEDTLIVNVITSYYHTFWHTENKKKDGTTLIENLNFNTFFEFMTEEIPKMIEKEGIYFNTVEFNFILKKFYKGGKYDKILNNDFDTALFDEKFIVFEIDNIKENKTLFPIVTLIIMDVFLQKMRLKKNRKALIIEEAWKAIACNMMANYIVYLYKTVRKFWGMAMVVTQELDDIIGNEVVKNTIINNSDNIWLLDQKKFIDNYAQIASLLSLNDIEKKKIFTINNLQNKDNRSRFNEVYIRRGSSGCVYGVEVSKHEYFTFTTERIEKDLLAYYVKIFGNYKDGLNALVSDLTNSNLKQGEWINLAFRVLSRCFMNNETEQLENYKTNLNDFFSMKKKLLNI